MKTPRRVLMTADTLGGVWTYAIELIRALPHVRFALCTMGAPLFDAQREELRRLDNAKLFTSRYKLEWMENPWAEVDAAGAWLLEVARDFDPDIVHLNGYTHAALNWSAAVIVIAHSCICSWWRAVKGETAPARFDEYRERVTAGLRAADLVIAPSAEMLHSLHENYPAQFRGRIIYNCRDQKLFHPGRKCPTIFSCGRVWDEAKNIQMLDRVARRVPWPIEVAGADTLADVKRTELRSVSFLGALSRGGIVRHLEDAAIFALPARYEPFGLSVLEAALSGCALVLGDIPSLRELWQDTAVFVDTEDEEALAKALNLLIAHQELRSDLSLRARNRGREFSSQRMAADYCKAYHDCLVSSPAEVAA